MRYRLNELGWYQFEKIVQSLLKAELGIGIECWGGHKDFGRDAYFKGVLEYPVKNEKGKGTFIFQVKYTEANPPQKFSRLKDAIIIWMKVNLPKLESEKDNAFYTIFTNVQLTASERKRLTVEIKEVLKFPDVRIHIQDGNDVCALLDNHPSIRWAYPQLLGIQDIGLLLEKLINKEIFEKSKGMLEEACELTAVFVPTKAYNETLNILTNHHFTVLEGPPEVGKTATAYIIALNKSVDRWEVYDCKKPDDFFKIYKHNKKQLFVADDAFGTTEYRPDLSADWARELDKILRKLDPFHWFIWTARSHILNMALQRMHLQDKAEGFPKPGEIIINISDFVREEKALILYRHAKKANLETFAKEVVKKYWKKVIDNPYFTPFRMKRFINETIPNILKSKVRQIDCESLSSIIDDELKNPTRSMEQAFDCLPFEYRKLLIALLDTKDSSYESLKSSFQRHCPESNKPFESILESLSSAFIKIEKEKQRGEWVSIRDREQRINWIHPSVRDLVINVLQDNSKDRKLFIRDCDIEGINLVLIPREKGSISPFLKENEDWEILIKKINNLIPKLNNSNLLGLMRNLEGVKDIYLQPTFIKHFFEIIKTTLNGVKAFVEDKDRIGVVSLDKLIFIDVRVLMMEQYYKLSLLIYPDLSIPDLKFLWEDLCRKAEEMLVSNWHISNKINVLENLLTFCNICASYEPRFLAKINFPQSVSTIVSRYLKDIENKVRFESSRNNADELFAQAEGWDEVAEFIQNVSSKFGQKLLLPFETKYEDLIEQCRDQSTHYRSKAESLPSPEEDYYDMSEQVEPHVSLAEIERIFDDL